MLAWLLSTRPRRTQTLDVRIYHLLQEHGPLDRYQIAVTLGTLDLPAIDDALHLLSRQNLACPRPDPGNEDLPVEDQPWGLWLSFHRAHPPPPPAA